VEEELTRNRSLRIFGIGVIMRRQIKFMRESVLNTDDEVRN
jgi:hypothetical protein